MGSTELPANAGNGLRWWHLVGGEVVIAVARIHRGRKSPCPLPSNESWISGEQRTPRISGIRCDGSERGKQPWVVVVGEVLFVAARSHRMFNPPLSMPANAGNDGGCDPGRGGGVGCGRSRGGKGVVTTMGLL